MDQLILRLLHQLGLHHVNGEDLSLQLQSHTDYPSIKSVTDTLDYFKVENLAIKVPRESLGQLPNNFLAIVRKEHETELVSIEKRKGHINILNQEGLKTKVTEQGFAEVWTGTIVALEGEEKAKRPHFVKVILREVLYLLLLGFFSVSLYLNHRSTEELWYILLSLIGVALSFLIAKESLGLRNDLGKKICNAISKDGSQCNSVINSEAGKLFKFFNLSDATVLYFSTSLTLIGLLGFHPLTFALLNATAVIGVLFSIYLQAFRLKKWCALCLLTGTVIIAQSIVLYPIMFFSPITWETGIQTIFILSMVSFLWFTLKRMLKANNELRQIKKAYFKFKRDPELFCHFMKREASLSVNSLPTHHQLVFGNRNAAIEITSITNPLCGYCKPAFQVYEHILSSYPEKIRLNIVFNVSPDQHNKATKIARQITEIYQENEVRGFRSLKEWFDHRNEIEWFEKHVPLSKNSLLGEKILQSHYQWCTNNEIEYTPETLINDRFFPKEKYEIEDLPLVINELEFIGFDKKIAS